MNLRHWTKSLAVLALGTLASCPDPRSNLSWRPCNPPGVHTAVKGDDQDPQSPYVLGYAPFCLFVGDAQQDPPKEIDHFELGGMKKDGSKLNADVVVEDGMLVGKAPGDPKKTVLGGADFKGVELQARFDSLTSLFAGDPLPFRITDVQKDTRGLYDRPGSRVTWLYHVQYSTDGGQRWQDVCRQPTPMDGMPADPVQNERARWSIPVAGMLGPSGFWQGDPTRFALSCGLGAVAECVFWGYRPEADDAARKVFQACVRMARADFCGNSHDHTCAGTKIEHRAATEPDFTATKKFEAAWGETGAICANKLRWNHLFGLCDIPNQQLNSLPACDGVTKAMEIAGRTRQDILHYSWSDDHVAPPNLNRCPHPADR